MSKEQLRTIYSSTCLVQCERQLGEKDLSISTCHAFPEHDCEINEEVEKNDLGNAGIHAAGPGL